jgi:soluble lytic murein transglycosylase-like protein
MIHGLLGVLLSGGMPSPVMFWIEQIKQANPALSIEAQHQTAYAIVDAAYITGLPQSLIGAVCYVESRFNSQARSGAGAVGVMQIIHKWHPYVPKSALNDPYWGVIWGTVILHSFLSDWGLEQGLKRWSGGRDPQLYLNKKEYYDRQKVH